MNKTAWAMGVLLAPLLQTASGSSWLAVGILGAACRILTEGMARYGEESPQWLKILRRIWSILILREVLGWIAMWWPEKPMAIPLILLLLACVLASVGKERIAVTAGIVLWLILVLVAPMLLAGAKELRWQYLRPQWRMTMPALVTVLLTPTDEAGKDRWLPALMMALLTQGVLSLPVSSDAENPIWELSRSLSLFGNVKRFESLIAVAMTLGFFAYLSHGLTREREGKREIRRAGVLTAALYLSGWTPDENIVAAGAVILEVMLPLLLALKKNMKKLKKSVDK